MKKAFLALLMLIAIPVFATTQWPVEVNAGGATITIYQPQYESFSEVTLVADAAISVTTASDPQPKFGAARLECTVSKDRTSSDLVVQTLTVGKMKLPDATDDQLSSYSSAMQEELADQHITFPVDDVRKAVSTQSDNSYDTAPPKILVMKHPAVLVTIDGEPILTDVDGSPLKRVSNTPFFLVNDPSSGNFYLKGGDVWYSATAIKGEWHQTMNPPLEVFALSEKMKDNEDSVQNAQAADEKEKTGKTPGIVVSTEPAELIATDGEPAFSPIEKTGLLYINNSSADVFLDITSQKYFILISGRWYTAPAIDGPWSFVASDKLPGDFAKIPPGSSKDNVLADVAGTVPATDAVLDANVPQAAAVQRSSATTQVQYDGDPQFQPIENTGMQYAVNTSSSVIMVNGYYYNCDQGIWFESPYAVGPWSVCVNVPRVIYTIPPRYPIYHVRYVRVYRYTPDVVYVGYTAGYTGCYVYGPTVVYGTGYYYHPWYRHYYYPRPYTWGFGVRYNPWSGWTIGIGTAWGRPYGWFSYNRGYYHGWWGPAGYRPWYYREARPMYGEGYRPARPFGAERNLAGDRRPAFSRPPTMYERRPVTGVRPLTVRQASVQPNRQMKNMEKNRAAEKPFGAPGRQSRITATPNNHPNRQGAFTKPRPQNQPMSKPARPRQKPHPGPKHKKEEKERGHE